MNEIDKSRNSWAIDFDRIIVSRNKAQQLEKENMLNEALMTYLQSIELSEQSNYLSIVNYAFDIERVIILYGKTNQTNKLKLYLQEKIQKYPDYRNVGKWMIRLSKIEHYY